MATLINTGNLVFGAKERKPLRGFPQGRVKLVIRNDDFVAAFVKTSDGIRKFYVESVDGFWQPLYEQASNTREVVSTS